MILGLDISTSICGFAVIDKRGMLVHHTALDLRKEKNIFAKCESFIQKLKETRQTYYGIDEVYIEQSLHMFMGGKSSAKTLSLLTRFNGMVSWVCYDQFGKEYIADTEPTFVVATTRFGNPKPEFFDRADAIVIARAGYNLEHTTWQHDVGEYIMGLPPREDERKKEDSLWNTWSLHRQKQRVSFRVSEVQSSQAQTFG